ncbi:unnamed protein product [Closterium sp. Yama58-4]|nr:unnamed protein product [Closterium sp. Yama58-4]
MKDKDIVKKTEKRFNNRSGKIYGGCRKSLRLIRGARLFGIKHAPNGTIRAEEPDDFAARCHAYVGVAAPPARTTPLPPANTSACPPEPSSPSNAPIVVRMRQPRSAPSPPRGGSTMAEAQQGVVEEEEPLQVEQCVMEVPVSAWGRLDWRCCWQQWAHRLASEGGAGGAEVARRVAGFAPQWALVVDWSAVPAFQAIAAAPVWADTVGEHGGEGGRAGGSVVDGRGESGRSGGQAAEQREQAVPRRPRMAYLNLRVYSLSRYQPTAATTGPAAASSAGEKGERGAEEEMETEAEAGRERAFYREKESEAVAMADVVTALSSRDARYLAESLGAGRKAGVEPHALLPPLREDIRVLAVGREMSAGSWPSDRLYLVCCVRLSPEKNAALLPPLLRLLAPHLPALGVTPLLCAGTAATRGAFGEAVLQEVLAAAPAAVVVDGFMGPDRMAQVYSQTLLNIHPCQYDAYGMTVVEAAAFAAPSVIHVGPGGAVGAAELLPPEEQLSLPVDLSAALPAVAESILALLRDRQHLAQVGLAARRRSLEWSEEASARSLTAMLQGASF